MIGRSAERSLGPRRRRDSGAAVELTPLIDIVFQLLIFFLLTATFQDKSSLDVKLAEANNQEKSTDQGAVVVSISSDGRLEIDKTVVEDQAELELRLCKERKGGRETMHVRADRDSKHEALVKTMDLAKKCGFKKMGILHTN